MESSRNGIPNDHFCKIQQLIAFLVAHRPKINWYMDGQAIRGQIVRGKYSKSCVCPVTAAYHLLFDMYAPPKISNSVANLVGIKKDDCVRINIACDYEDDDIYGIPLRQYIIQSLLWNFE